MKKEAVICVGVALLVVSLLQFSQVFPLCRERESIRRDVVKPNFPPVRRRMVLHIFLEQLWLKSSLRKDIINIDYEMK